MSYDNYYAVGSASVENGSAEVDGHGTGWLTSLVSGGVFIMRGLSVPIQSVSGEGFLTLAAPWPGATLAEEPYQIGLVSADAATALWANRQLAQVISRAVGSTIATRYSYGVALSERDAFDAQPAGFVFVLVEAGEDPVLYIKETDTSADWSTAKPWRGPPGAAGVPGGALNWIEAGWLTATAYVENDAVPHEGSSYRCHTAHTSDASSEPGVGADWEDYWMPVAEKGDQGDQGEEGPQGDTGPQGSTGPIGIVFRGAWNSGDNYAVNDIVIDDDAGGDPAAWIAVDANTNSRPRDNPADWTLFPGSFPDTVDDGLWDDLVESSTDDGEWGA